MLRTNIVLLVPRSSQCHPSSWISSDSECSSRSLSSSLSSSRLTHAQFRSLLAIDENSARIFLSEISLSGIYLIQAVVGRVAATIHRPRVSSTDNVHRTQIGHRQHAPADALARSGSDAHLAASFLASERAEQEYARYFRPASDERVSSMCAGQESKREVRDRRSVG